MILKITRKEEPNLFEDMSEFIKTHSYKEHRRSSNFFTRSIIEFKPEYAEYFPQLNGEFEDYIGTWETNDYISDTEYGTDWRDVTELTRVVPRVEIIEKTIWEVVK